MRSMTEINQELIGMVPAQALVKTSTSANKENVAKETSANDASIDHVSAVSLKSVKVSSVEYLTVQEFDKIPKYMKGRLNYDSLTLAVKEFNQCLEAKYQFLSQPLNSLGLKDKKRRNLLKAQDKPELKSKQFITADDLKQFSMFKTEQSKKSIFTVLRHFQRIREVRGPGPIVRFVVC